jgi:dihydropteroate synthase
MSQQPQPEGLPTQLLNLGRPLVFGILNVTPDSFSDGGRFTGVDTAVAAGVAMMQEGADIIDVGGESTRPGATRVDSQEELRRVIPVVQRLEAEGIPVSIDTMRAQVAHQAVDVGAVIVNDVSGGLADADMLPTVARLSVPYILMHWRGHGAGMDALADYDDVVDDVLRELRLRVGACVDAGIARERLVVDPGLGFAKDAHHNWQLLAHIDQLERLDLPILIGASRKRFLGALLATGETPREIPGRLAATVALTALAAMSGVWAVRVHDVRENADAVRVAVALQKGQ